MLRILIVKNSFKIEISLRAHRFCTEKEMLMAKKRFKCRRINMQIDCYCRIREINVLIKKQEEKTTK